jgi:hypothetical protein
MQWHGNQHIKEKVMELIDFEAYLNNLEEEAMGKYPDHPQMQRAHLCGALRATAAFWAMKYNLLASKVKA